jgi:Ankyrin repeats (3 copies)
MSKSSAMVLVALALTAFALVFYARERRARVSVHVTSASPALGSAPAQKLSSQPSAVPASGSATQKGYSETEYDFLWQHYRLNTSQADGPLPADGLKVSATSIKNNTSDRNMWPVIRDVVYGNSSALEKKLDTGRLNPDATYYMEYPYDTYESLFDTAIKAGQRGVIKALLDHGASVNARELYSSNGSGTKVASPLPIAAGDGEDDVVRSLLDRNVNINQRSGGSGGDTALGAAVYAQNVSTVYLLLTHGADINSVLGSGGTVPQFLVRADQRAPRMIALRNLLIEYGAKMTSEQ